MKIKITNREDLLNAYVYYPSQEEGDWLDLKNKAAEFNNIPCSHLISVKNVAEYLLNNIEIKNSIARIIIEFYKNFDIDKFSSESIETCPGIDGMQNRFFLRGGNKRCIAYAMKILNREMEFSAVESEHLLFFTRLDNNNLAGIPTSKYEDLE